MKFCDINNSIKNVKNFGRWEIKCGTNNKDSKQKNFLNTNFLGKKIFIYDTIDSTQKEVWRRVSNCSIASGTLIIANTQTAGIGTHGKSWHTDFPDNIAFSFAIEANCNIEKIEGITLQIAKTLVKTFEDLYNIKLNIKHPNDLVYNNKKIGGILTETKIQAEIVKYIVIGIGINTNQISFAKEINSIASSIKKEFGISVDNKNVISKFCELFEKWLIEKQIVKNN